MTFQHHGADHALRVRRPALRGKGLLTVPASTLFLPRRRALVTLAVTMVSRLVCLASLLLLLTSCGVFKRAPKTPAAQEPPAVLEVGQIDMVNEIQKFVLIHAPGRVTLSPGTLMDVIGPEGIKARVKLAPERKGSYLTADIESGIPAKGDGVVWHRTPPPSPGASTAEPSPAEENTGTFIDPLVPVPPAPVTPSPPVPSASISPPSASLSPSAPPPPP